MALHKDFPKSPHAILDSDIRWFPADEQLREQGYDRLLPLLVATLRRRVKERRDSGYDRGCHEMNSKTPFLKKRAGFFALMIVKSR